jgi:HD-GYP domain-containing protein (c-di-GMP phosphodiesterase class II)/HAMP domain-containing protein
VAAVLATEGQTVLDASRRLSQAFKDMMQRKLAGVLALQLGVIVATVVTGLLLLGWLRHRVVGPLRAVERGAQRLVEGELGLAIPERGDREIAAVGGALNRLSQRLKLLFDVADRTNAGLTTAELLDTLRDALGPVVPIDLLGIAVRNADEPGGWRMHRTSGSPCPGLADGQPLRAGPQVGQLATELAAVGERAGLRSVLVVPLLEESHEAAALVFAASAAGVMTETTRALLHAVAGPVRGQLDRTLSTEALVVAAVEGLATLAESRDPETGDHLVRMSAYSAMLGAELARDPAHAGRIDARYVDDLRRFAPMHDIGKVGIADSILLKPGRLTDEERAEMSRHPLIGAEVLRRCEAQMQARGRSVFRVAIEIAEGHHEKWDGSGYPQGLAGEAIPLAARIVAVADVLDALTSRRPYKEAWPMDRALATIDADAGRHFDPAVVAALHRCLPDILAFYERHKHV